MHWKSLPRDLTMHAQTFLTLMLSRAASTSSNTKKGAGLQAVHREKLKRRDGLLATAQLVHVSESFHRGHRVILDSAEVGLFSAVKLRYDVPPRGCCCSWSCRGR